MYLCIRDTLNREVAQFGRAEVWKCFVSLVQIQLSQQNNNNNNKI